MMSDTPATSLRVLIVEDEAPARSRLRMFLRDEPGVECVGECANGRQAVDAIRRERPDAIFLDIRMPQLDGFGVLEQLEESEMPLVVFTTAYDEYAVRAFEVHAVDYLLKPFDRDRLRRALDHLRKCRAPSSGMAPNWQAALKALARSLARTNDAPDVLPVKVDGRTVLLRRDEIDWIEAEGNYVRFHVGPASHLVRDTLTWCERQCTPPRFVRVNRSAIVNAARIREVVPLFSGDQTVILRDGTKLVLSRNYRERLDAVLGARDGG